MKKIYVFSFIILLVLAFSTSVTAADWELSGGYLYTKINMGTDDLFGSDSFNAVINEGFEEEPILEVTDYSKIDALKKADGFYLGLGREIADYLVTLSYENFSNQERGFIESKFVDNDETIIIREEAASEIEFDGFVIKTAKQIAKNFSLNFSVGHYNADLEEKYTLKQNGEILTNSSGKAIYNVDSGFGFKVGAEYSYLLSSNWSLNANANYRVLGLDYELDHFEGNSNPSAADKEAYSGELDLDGYELTAGFSLIF